MSAPILKSYLSRGSLVSHHLCAAKKELQAVLSGLDTLSKDELDSLAQEASEVLSLIQSRRNRLAPINRLPRDVLILIPDYLDGRERAKIVINLTHVCQFWREIFISRASLWTDFHCLGGEKTRVYLKRSGSAPINVWLERALGLSIDDPFLEIFPNAIRRLKSLSVKSTSGYLQDIVQHLAHPAPLLGSLSINGSWTMNPAFGPFLPVGVFGGDLSSLRKLHLQSVRTQLPWRGMNNLTSFSLLHTLQPTVSQILDFLKSAPRLTEIELSFAAPTSGAQDGRLVTLAYLRRLTISGSQRPSLLLNHLIVPVGAKLSTEFTSPGPHINDHLPASLDNLRNLSHFTQIRLRYEPHFVSMRFTGPNGQVSITSSSPEPDAPCVVPRSLAQFDTSKTRRLEIVGGNFTTELHEALVSLKNLRTLVVSGCDDIFTFLLAIHPIFFSDSVVCPELEELVFRTSQLFDMESMVEVAKDRALKVAPLKSVKIVSFGEPVQMEGVRELLEHVTHVETSVEVDGEHDYFYEDTDTDEEH